jgi:hypothetical protein
MSYDWWHRNEYSWGLTRRSQWEKGLWNKLTSSFLLMLALAKNVYTVMWEMLSATNGTGQYPGLSTTCVTWWWDGHDSTGHVATIQQELGSKEMPTLVDGSPHRMGRKGNWHQHRIHEQEHGVAGTMDKKCYMLLSHEESAYGQHSMSDGHGRNNIDGG